MGTNLSIDTVSNRGISASMRSRDLTISGEAGAPLRLGGHLALEPEGQIIWQRLSVDPASDPFTTLDFDLDDSILGRVGLRLQGSWTAGPALLQPNLFVNFWDALQGTDHTTYNSAVTLDTPFEAKAIEAGGGLVARLSARFGVYARGSYTTNAGGDHRQTVQAVLGAHLSL